MKINHAQNSGPVTFFYLGAYNNKKMYFSRLSTNEFQYGARRHIYFWNINFTIPVPDNEWFHLAIKLDQGANKLSGYINGRLDQGISHAPTDTEAALRLSEVALHLGGKPLGESGYREAHAAYGDLKLFPRTLSGDDITKLYKCGVLGEDRVTVWKPRPIKTSNPDELKVRCLVRSNTDHGPLSWYMFTETSAGGVQQFEALPDDIVHGITVTNNDTKECFYESELAINKYKLSKHLKTDHLGRRSGSNGERQFLVCHIGSQQDGPGYETLELNEDLTYVETSWLSSSNPYDNDIADNETIAHIHEIYPNEVCDHPVAIRCRERYTVRPYSEFSLVNTFCDEERGLLCRHDDQTSGRCPDFEVKFTCHGSNGVYNIIAVERMLIVSLTDDVLEASCRTAEAGLEFSWSFYNSSSNLHKNISPGDGTATSSTDLESLLTVSNPAGVIGLYVVCVLSDPSVSERNTAHDSLRVDTDFHGDVAFSMASINSTLVLNCTADGDTVHAIDWYFAPSDGAPSRQLFPSRPYVRRGYFGGYSVLEVANFETDGVGSYTCSINWNSTEVVRIIPTVDESSTMQSTTLFMTSTDQISTVGEIDQSTTPSDSNIQSTSLDESHTSQSATDLPSTNQDSWSTMSTGRAQASTDGGGLPVTAPIGTCVDAANNEQYCRYSTDDIETDSLYIYPDVSKDYDKDTGAHFTEQLQFDVSQVDVDEFYTVFSRKEVQPAPVDLWREFPETKPNRLNSTRTTLNSAIMSFSLYDVNDEKISVPVTYTMGHMEDTALTGGGKRHNFRTVREPLCVYSEDEDIERENWSLWGCELVVEESTGLYSTCACNHSTSFAVLMQVRWYEIPRLHELTLTWITQIGLSISISMLLLTLATFFYLRRKLSTDRTFIHTNLSIALLLGQAVFLVGLDMTTHRSVCKAIALILHFCYLSVFGWMLVEGVHLYLKVVKVYGTENIKMYPYLFVGWGIPAIITVVSFGTRHDGYGSKNSCWLGNTTGLIWAFVSPAMFVIMCNTIVLTMVVRIVMKTAHEGKRLNRMKAGIKGTMFLLPFLGVTWVFGLLAINDATIIFEYIFAVFNSLQGLFIFVISCLLNSEVRAAFFLKRLKKKQTCPEILNCPTKQSATTKMSTSSSSTGRTKDVDDTPIQSSKTTLTGFISEKSNIELSKSTTTFKCKKNGKSPPPTMTDVDM